MDFSREIIHSPSALNKIKPIEIVLDDIRHFLTEIEARKISKTKINLNSLKFKNYFIFKHPNYKKFERIYTVSDKKIIALIEIDNGLIKPKRVINY